MKLNVEGSLFALFLGALAALPRRALPRMRHLQWQRNSATVFHSEREGEPRHSGATIKSNDALSRHISCRYPRLFSAHEYVHILSVNAGFFDDR
ncbi:hypothetical protein BDD14_1672 [Edaphobacter modestus]|uniref:Uncharacterized protein n=1 Tax=Edaphobacter modestus TaxID=388466 RepID=A0A4Q7YRA5_9BACT|nr:hypothetical protein BDD14_1672 [Edaphobacter modestus]